MELVAKRRQLESILRELGSVLVAYSGGVDSTYLADAAHRVLGNRCLAVTADSESYAQAQAQDADRFAAQLGFPHRHLRTFEFQKEEYRRNHPDRCFHCKDELFNKLWELARAEGYAYVIYGANTDDLGDFRPGQKAAQQHGVRAPLVEAGLSKAEVRALAKETGLEVHDKPASACLSSRIPYFIPVTTQALSQVERGEDALRQLGFRQFRVRHHESLVRLEFAPEELARALSPDMAPGFVQIFKDLGYKYITIDLEGYRSGSLNEVLPNGRKAGADPT